MDDRISDPAGGTTPSHDPPPDSVRIQLDKILSSPDFARSDRLQKFLRFIVEETLAGRAGALKEYTIALEVFERGDSFDPQTSSIVRVEANRLRIKLEKYNATEGRDDPLRIALPQGSYKPTFQMTLVDPDRNAASAENLSGGMKARWALQNVDRRGILTPLVG